MLVLARKQEEAIVIGENVEIKILEIKGDQVRLGIVAPQSVSIYRKELYEKIKAENIEAVKSKKDKLKVPNKFEKGGEEGSNEGAKS
ncbi:MAG: carbon storage regulator CsrA [Candidatus Omnitrophica bacterium]|nr:carbon storage regulator CsrA [Candidatus Omnitrophota bacterium]